MAAVMVALSFVAAIMAALFDPEQAVVTTDEAGESKWEEHSVPSTKQLQSVVRGMAMI